MKKLIIALALILGCLFSGSASADIIEKQKHRDWESFILTFNGGSCARMTTTVGNTMLAVDIHPKSAQFPYGMYQVKMMEILHGQQKAGWEMMVPITLHGKMRVDARTIYEVRFDFSLEGDILFANLGGEFNTTLVDEAMRGLRLHLRINSPKAGGNPAIATFSLMGFTAAYNRCMNLMPLLERMSAPAPAPAPQADPFAGFGKAPAPQKAEPSVPVPTPSQEALPKPEYRDANVVFM
jgi:hypothetical protein